MDRRKGRPARVATRGRHPSGVGDEDRALVPPRAPPHARERGPGRPRREGQGTSAARRFRLGADTLRAAGASACTPPSPHSEVAGTEPGAPCRVRSWWPRRGAIAARRSDRSGEA
jgi:hypothetical protein